ncbi:MAG TPA: hypothetical protein VHB19_11875 [Devosia sp.]|nr:hypothetical protein [Devosia sp.]
MRMRSRLDFALALGLGAALLAPLPALAETSLTAFDAARQALLSIWAELPLTVRNVTLTDGPAAGYGNYTVHPGSEFRAGEKIHVYVEVLGYGWKDNGDGTLSEVLDADLNLLDAQGTTVASQQHFLTADIRSRQKLLETFLTLDATLTSFDPGAYKLQYVLHDRAGGKQATFEVPITLVAADASAPPADASSSAASAASASAAG